jgi:hypothetical protein
LGNKVYRGKNPPRGAMFTYRLPETLGQGIALTAEILDEAGTVLREIAELPREAGVHRASWDLRVHGETPRRGKPGDALRDAGPYAKPGAYRLRLTAGQTVREERVQVHLDPALGVSDAAFSEASALANRLRESLSRANGALRSLDQLKSQLVNLEKLSPAASQDPTTAAKLLRESMAAIDERIATLSWPDDGYRLEDRPGLVQKLSQAYSTLSSTLSLPLAHQAQYAESLESAASAAAAGIQRFVAETVPRWNAELKRLGLGELPVPQ